MTRQPWGRIFSPRPGVWHGTWYNNCKGKWPARSAWVSWEDARAWMEKRANEKCTEPESDESQVSGKQ